MPLTDKQLAQVELLQNYPNVLSYGGARSGKTYGIITFLVYCCDTQPNTRILIARKYATDIRGAIWNDTLPKVLTNTGHIAGEDYTTIEASMNLTFSNGSRIICGGLDDKERVDKILGQEYFAIYLNEAQDIPYSTVKTMLTRLAQKVVVTIDGVEHVAQNRFLADVNPTSINHWLYKLFIMKRNPENGDKIPYPDSYVSIQMNPHDNKANLPPGYIERALEVLSGNSRNRFLLGEFTTNEELKVFSPRGTYKWAEFMEWFHVSPNDVQLIGGLDLGFQDCDAFCIIAYRDGDRHQWLIYEYKARRKTTLELVDAIKRGQKWAADNIPCRNTNFEIYGDTQTVHYGKEGDSKKSIRMLSDDYGLPVRPAYKRDKRLAVDHFQGEVNSGFFHVINGGEFFNETENTVWTRNDDGSIIREIDDSIYHPDMLDAILYPLRYLVSYGNKALIPEEPKESVDLSIEHADEIFNKLFSRQGQYW